MSGPGYFRLLKPHRTCPGVNPACASSGVRVLSFILQVFSLFVLEGSWRLGLAGEGLKMQGLKI